MSEKKTIRAGAVCLLVSLLAALFFTACVSKAVNAADKIELGQKYLTELNYTEAVASFTEAIKLDPDNIQAYMGRAEAYMALGEYDKALADYRFISGTTENMPTFLHRSGGSARKNGTACPCRFGLRIGKGTAEGQ